MDHLPVPVRSRNSYPKIPCLLHRRGPVGNEILIGSPAEWILGLGEKFERIKQHILGGLDKGMTVSDVDTPIQSWLWFGTIETVFNTVGVSINLKDWIVSDETGHVWLSTSVLNRHLWYWAVAESSVSDETKAQHCKIINECLSTVSSALTAWVVHERNTTFPEYGREGQAYLQDDGNNILLGISVLGETLDFAQARIYAGKCYPSKPWFQTSSQRQWLLEAGWCVSEITRFLQRPEMIVCPQLYRSRMDRRSFGKSHEGCTFRECVHAKIDVVTYRPSHAREGCICAHLRLSMSEKRKIDDLLHGTYYPVITCSRTSVSDPGYHLRVHEPDIVGDEMMYVAISHVWSDRGGNLVENALPTCQLAKIQNQVNALYPEISSDIPFWMDTICVPRETHLRALAIQKMRDVYQKAHKVLVLDSTLQLVESSDPPEEILTVISLAPWCTRLWTWHESALARRLYFQLKGRAIEGDKLRKLYNTEFSNSPTTTSLHDVLNDLNGPNSKICKRLLRIMTLWPDRAEHWNEDEVEIIRQLKLHHHHSEEDPKVETETPLQLQTWRNTIALQMIARWRMCFNPIRAQAAAQPCYLTMFQL